jgi:uncharacterized protein (TIGR03086 family)
VSRSTEEDTVNEQEVFVAAEKALRGVVAQIDSDQWARIVPDYWTRTPGSTLREVINYHACDDAWVPDVLAGKTIEQVGPAHDGDLLGADPKASFAAIAETATTAVRACDDLDATVHLSYGDYPAREYLKHITYFRGLRAYDLARFIGADTALPDELVRGLWSEIAPVAEEWRELGVFGPAVPVAADASLQDRLLGLVGRRAA